MDQQTNQKRFPSVCSVWEALLKLIGQDTATSLQTRQNTANQRSLFKLCCIQGLYFHSHKSGKLVGFNDSRGAVSCTWMHRFLIFHVKFCRQWMQHLSVLAEHHGNRSFLAVYWFHQVGLLWTPEWAELAESQALNPTHPGRQAAVTLTKSTKDTKD